MNQIHRVLTETQGPTFKPDPKRVPLDFDVLADERQFELIVLYTIDAAIVAYGIRENLGEKQPEVDSEISKDLIMLSP